MAMTQKLWSLNALATEFDMDRRTVAQRIRGVQPAGSQRGYPVWHLDDVAAFLAKKRKPSAPASECTLAEVFMDRLAHDEPVEGHRVSLAEFSEMSGAGMEALLTWLRVGMPYVKAGDWKTGQGFEVITHHAFDWSVHAVAIIRAGASADTIRALRMG